MQKSLENNSCNRSLKRDITVIISKEVWDKIRILCTKLHNVEWSGILLYTIKEGSIGQKKLILETKDIILMDIGNSVRTGFEYTKKKEDSDIVEDKFVDYMMEHPEATGYMDGLIHSHNSMETFFSEVDIQEIRNNTPNHTFYLSVVVNNMGDIIAKIGLAISTDKDIKIEYKYQDEIGKIHIMNITPEYNKKEVLFANCKVKVDMGYSDLLKDIEILQKEKRKERAKIASSKNDGFSSKFGTLSEKDNQVPEEGESPKKPSKNAFTGTLSKKALDAVEKQIMLYNRETLDLLYGIIADQLGIERYRKATTFPILRKELEEEFFHKVEKEKGECRPTKEQLKENLEISLSNLQDCYGDIVFSEDSIEDFCFALEENMRRLNRTFNLNHIPLESIVKDLNEIIYNEYKG